MPASTPVPVTVVGLSETLWTYGDKAEDFARLALWFGAFSTVIIVALLAALVVVTGLRRA